jgi:tRNA pseudouridine55 synthase
MGKKNILRGRDVHGILLLDKPTGITSNGALQRVKRLYGARKAGHTGSLDKMASGLLPICLGEATKFAGYLLEADKHYRATCKLGIMTNTGDATGEVKSVRTVPGLNRKKIEKAFADFRGEISQVPPMYSALKHQGQRLYQLAYQGINVERKARNITIHGLILLEHREDVIEIEVRCSKGTYIRTLVEDIGEKLGCGAHVSALRRIGSGPFNEEQMITSTELERLAEKGQSILDQQLIAIDSILSHLAAVEVVDSVACYILQGQAVMIPHAPTEGLVRIYTQDRDFLGIGKVLDDGRITPKRLLQSVSERNN